MKRALIYSTTLTSATFTLFNILIGIIKDKKLIDEIYFIVCSLSYISRRQLLIKILNSKDYIYFHTIRYYFSNRAWQLDNYYVSNIVGLGFPITQIVLYKVYKEKKIYLKKLEMFLQLL